MKYLLVLCCVIVAVLAQEKYTTKYNNVNIDEILENDRLLIAYVNCLLDKGKCSPEGKELKDHIQDALETGCSKCTEDQIKAVEKVIAFLIEKKLLIWKELTAKFDPDSKWRKTYEDRAKASGIVIPE